MFFLFWQVLNKDAGLDDLHDQSVSAVENLCGIPSSNHKKEWSSCTGASSICSLVRLTIGSCGIEQFGEIACVTCAAELNGLGRSGKSSI